ncbi:MAG: tetratricopeptide repeat protein [Syntrophobacteria bacterium]
MFQTGKSNVEHVPKFQFSARKQFLLLFLCGVTLLIYYPAILSPFCILDDGLLVEHVLNRLNEPIWSFVKDQFQLGRGGAYHRPIATITFFGIAKIMGLQPEPFHLLNVLFHLGCGLLIYFLIKHLYGNSGSGFWAAFVAAMLFLVHPLNVEAVAWVSGRPTLMATFFALMAFFFHVRITPPLSSWRLWVAGIFYLLSLLSYELAAAMPLAFVYWDLNQQEGSGKGARRCYRRWLPYAAAFALYAGFRLLRAFGGRSSANIIANAGDGTGLSKAVLAFSHVFHDFLAHLSSPLVALGLYVKKVVWPWPLNFYIAEVPCRSLYAGLGAVFLTICLWWIWRRSWMRFWAFWFVCGLVPVLFLSFHPFSWTAAAERYVYLSSVAFSAFVSIMIFRISALRTRRMVQLMLVVLLAAFMIGSALRAGTWQSNLALLEDTWEKNPYSGATAHHYANALSISDRREEAIRYWKKAIELGYPVEPSLSLARIEETKKNYEAAEKYYLEALHSLQKRQSRDTRAGRILEAVPPGKVVKIYLALADLHSQMAGATPQEKTYHQESMVRYYESACRLKPGDAFLKYLLAKAYLRCGNLEDARFQFREANRLAPETFYGKAAARLAKVEKIGEERPKQDFQSFLDRLREPQQPGK